MTGIPVTQYSVDSYMQGKQYIFGLQMGATYKITDYLAVFGGLRMNYASNSYIGYIRNIKINPAAPEMGLNGNMLSAYDLLNTLASQGQLPEEALSYVDKVKDKELDCDQTGWGG